jgi:dTDP-4-dehydrorhamnose 3,5-epimerase
MGLSMAPRDQLPHGVIHRPLTMHCDERGALTEVFRQSWDAAVKPVQWNIMTSEAGILRGVHVHPRHVDYVVLVHGRASMGLRDLRPGSPTEGLATLIEMRGDPISALTIPPGVAHGFLFHEPSTLLYGVSEYWDPADEIGCHWADPALEIPWPVTAARTSARDAEAPPLSEVLRYIPPFGSVHGPD